MEKTSQLISLVVQAFAIIALVVTVVLVLQRKAVCSFYELPTTYSSLDPVSVIPTVTAILVPIIIIIFLLPIVSSSYEEEEQKSDSIEDRKNKKAEERRISREIFESTLYSSIKVRLTVKSTMDIWILMIYAFGSVMITFFINNIIMGRMQSGMLMNVLMAIFIVFFYTSLFFVGVLFWVHLQEEYNNVLNKNDEIKKNTLGEKKRPVNHTKGSINLFIPKVMLFLLIVFWVLSTAFNLIETMRLTLTYQYGIVEMKNTEEQYQSYAVVLDTNEYYVLEPIEENGDEMTISTERFIYKEKDNVEVIQRHYRKVFINRYSLAIREKYGR